MGRPRLLATRSGWVRRARRLGAYGMSDFVGDLIAVAEAWAGTTGRVHLVGHSFGGIVARAAVVKRPDLFASVTLFCSGRAVYDWMNTLPILDPLPTGPGARQQVLRTYFPDMNFDEPGVGWAEFQRVRALDTASETWWASPASSPSCALTPRRSRPRACPCTCCTGTRTRSGRRRGTRRRPPTWVPARASSRGHAQPAAAVPAPVGGACQLVLGGR